MYCVHWISTERRLTDEQVQTWHDMTGELLDITDQVNIPKHKMFSSTELTQAVKFCEELRTRRRAGEKLSFISMASEDPNSVGEQGVSDKLPEGYDWKKRRI